jgi:hypothetical protein
MPDPDAVKKQFEASLAKMQKQLEQEVQLQKASHAKMKKLAEQLKKA